MWFSPVSFHTSLRPSTSPQAILFTFLGWTNHVLAPTNFLLHVLLMLDSLSQFRNALRFCGVSITTAQLVMQWEYYDALCGRNSSHFTCNCKYLFEETCPRFFFLLKSKAISMGLQLSKL